MAKVSKHFDYGEEKVICEEQIVVIHLGFSYIDRTQKCGTVLRRFIWSKGCLEEKKVTISRKIRN